MSDFQTFIKQQLSHDGRPYHIETSPLICPASELNLYFTKAVPGFRPGLRPSYEQAETDHLSSRIT